MSVTVEWDNPEQTIIHYDLGSNWTWEELRKVMLETWPLITERKVIVDGYMTSQHQHMPPNAMMHLRTITQSRPLNTGVMVLVGANSMMKNMITTFMNIYNNMFQRETPLAFAETVEEAREIIRQKKAARVGTVNS